jgi:TonB family protein
MKNNIITLFLVLLFSTGFSQNSKYEYNGRLTPSVKKEKLNEVKFISDITPELWHKLALPIKEHDELDYRRKMEYSLGYYLYPQGGYNIIIDYVSVEILATCNSKVLTSQSTSDKLTPEQKNILNAADLGSDISIKIKFKYKNQAKDSLGSSKIIEGKLAVTVVPETEAEFPGGFKQITEYLMKNVINKITEASTSEKIRQAIVKFTVNEEGQVVDAKILRTSTDPKIDDLLLNAINKMPKWVPAKNSKGIKVKQEFSIPFGSDSGC